MSYLAITQVDTKYEDFPRTLPEKEIQTASYLFNLPRSSIFPIAGLLHRGQNFEREKRIFHLGLSALMAAGQKADFEDLAKERFS